MGITMGLLMFILGILGVLISVIVLCLLPGHFEKQRKELMDQIEKEY
ncbi:MAG: hypothetical protein Q4B37_04140 [Eubacteriales bacterium]|nr:hypothetical protein [Eubacteriales bacterium]